MLGEFGSLAGKAFTLLLPGFRTRVVVRRHRLLRIFLASHFGRCSRTTKCGDKRRRIKWRKNTKSKRGGSTQSLTESTRMIECDGAQSMSCWSSRTSCKPHTTAHYVSGSRVRTSAATHERVQWTFTQGDRIKHNAERRMPQETRRNTPGPRRPLNCAC